MMNNSWEYLADVDHAAAGLTNQPSTPMQIQLDDLSTAHPQSIDIDGQPGAIPAQPAQPDQLDNLQPQPIHIPPEQEQQLRQLAVKYKQYADELEKSFYSQQEYYVISSRWLKRWKVFVSYQQSTSNTPSTKHLGSGTLPPVNCDLIDKSLLDIELPEPYDHLNNALRPNLKQHLDYELISTDMWRIFAENYQHYSFRRYLENTQDGKKVEVYFYRTQAIILYNEILKEIEREYVGGFKKVELQLPRFRVVGEGMMAELTDKVKGFVRRGENPAWGMTSFSKDNMRVWAVSDDLTESKLMSHLSKCCRANTSYHYKIYLPGEPLQLQSQTLQSLQLSPSTLLIFQLKQQGNDWTLFNKNKYLLGKCDYCRDVRLLHTLCSCNNAAYCSKDCKSKDKQAHSYKCERDAESSEEEGQGEKAMAEGSRRGVMGLRNLGNTCFMNSGIQCLTSVRELTEFFLSRKYLSDINQQNPIGTKGELSKAYAKQLQKMWYDEEESVAPTVLKRAIGKFQPMFMGYDQHDSGELISYLLDGLHEDLNRVKLKPYTETKDYDGRPDEVVAKESWEQFLMRNQSIIVDLMYGQYKSRLQCPKCAKVSVTFDPFLMVPLPVPQNSNKIFELLYEKQDHITTVKLQIPYKKQDNLRLSDISNMVSTSLKVPNNLIAVGVSYYDSKLLDMNSNANENRKNYKRKSIMFRQLQPEENLQTDQPINVLQTLCSSLSGNENYRRNLTKPRIFLFKPTTTCKQIHHRFLKYFGHLLGVKDYEKQVINAEPDDQKWRVLLVTKSSYETCHYCNSLSCYNCPVPYSDDVTIQDLNEKCAKWKDTHKLDFEIYWRKNAEDVEKVFEKAELTRNYQPGKDATANPTIYDCLRLAEEPETLGQDNAWYCPSCKDFVLANKQMMIYKAPKILIMYFKRFKNKGYFKSKLTTYIDFPLNDLDMSQFVLNHQLPSSYTLPTTDGPKPSPHYSLFAISNHYGGLGGGHYTAYCKKNGKWYDCDDSSVASISEERLVDTASYVLFYERNDGV